jgi:DNA-binding response OmpR family regulator
MSTHSNILLAEDDVDFGSVLKQYLEVPGFSVQWAKDGEEALSLFNKSTFNMCVLDVMMPKLEGFSVAEQIIEINPEILFIFLTARKMKEDKLKGLKLGAEDYIIKPFEADALVLRLRNILKRTQNSTITIPIGEIIRIGKYQFNTKRLELQINDQIQRFTEKEGELIEFLFQHKNQMLKSEEILNAVWHRDDFFSGRSMDVFISRMRKYFKEDPAISIESIRGIGLEFKLR